MVEGFPCFLPYLALFNPGEMTTRGPIIRSRNALELHCGAPEWLHRLLQLARSGATKHPSPGSIPIPKLASARDKGRHSITAQQHTRIFQLYCELTVCAKWRTCCEKTRTCLPWHPEPLAYLLAESLVYPIDRKKIPHQEAHEPCPRLLVSYRIPVANLRREIGEWVSLSPEGRKGKSTW